MSLYVENEFGCSDQETNQIQVNESFTFFVPNAFTPNGDGMNDYFQAEATGILDFHMKIYDRWGELIYSSEDIHQGWDGNVFSGEVMGSGTYMYHISLLDYNEKLWIYNGEFDLMR